MSTCSAESTPDRLTDADLASYRTLFRIALPLVFSMSSATLMHLLDGLFLSWYSASAMAAQGPSSMAVDTVNALFVGVVSFGSTLVAQYHGANQPTRVGAVLWQALWLAWVFGAIVMAIGALGSGVFAAVGHEASLAAQEAEYFRVCCWFAPVAMSATALSGFFSGRGDTKSLMVAQIAAQFVNIGLDWLLIFGYGPVPALGVAGAAWATNASQLLLVAVLAALVLRRRYRETYGTWTERRFDFDICWRLVRFGVPTGLNYWFGSVSWAVFFALIGRLGAIDLAASNIGMRLSTVASMPAYGLFQAVESLVGQAQGRRRPDLARVSARNGMIAAQTIEGLFALAFWICPMTVIGWFEPHWPTDPQSARVAAAAVIVLRYVAIFSLVAGANYVLDGALGGAGDTKIMFYVCVPVSLLFIGAMLLVDRYHGGLSAACAVATAQIFLQASCYAIRWRSGRWAKIKVIEAATPTDLATS